MGKAIVFLSIIFSAYSYGFTLSVSNGAFFKNNTERINVADNCVNLGMTSSGLLSLAVEGSVQFWNKVPTSRLRIVQGTVLGVAGNFYTDAICSSNNPCVPNTALAHSHEILISCNTNITNFSSTAVLAVTVPNNVVGQNINAATLLINDVAANQFKDKSRAEQMAILAHEIGHAIGLGHSPVIDSLMYYQSISTRYRLGWDDIDGITYLYPTEQPISGCGSVDLNSPPPSQIGPLIFGLLLTMLIGAGFKHRLFAINS